MNKKELQQTQLLYALEKQSRMDISEIKAMLNISESTARRMIVSLEQKGLAIRKFGGVQRFSQNQPSYSYTEVKQKMIDEKRRIGQIASSFVLDNDVIFISGGTTALQMAISLEQLLRNDEIHNLTVLTSSLVNVETLGSSCKVILIGGEYRPERRDFSGFMAEKFIKNISMDKCFIGVDGLNIEDGLMSYDIETARIDELVIARSNQTTILCDSSKFSKMSFVTLAPISKANIIITDIGISPVIKSELESSGIKVYTALEI